MSIHEQARAEAEKKFPDTNPLALALAMRDVFQQGFLAGHEAAHRERCPHQKCPGGSLCCCTDEAATRTRVVTSVDQLDALPVGSVVLTTDGAIWQQFRGPRGQIAWRSAVWAGAYSSADLNDYGGGLLPARVLHEPEEGR